MCGIFGAVGHKPNSDILRSLAIVNRERGTHSWGFFDSRGRIIKDSGDVLHDMSSDTFCKMTSTWHNCWFVAGHTRYATRGNITKRNAHPFQYGKVIGCHNGVIHNAPMTYEVDSEVIFDELDANDNDYQKALHWLDGYFSVAWYRKKRFYLLSYRQELSCVRVDDVLYYSSSDEHLSAVTGRQDVYTFDSGEIWCFMKNRRPRRLKNLKVKSSMPTYRHSPYVFEEDETAFEDLDWKVKSDDDYRRWFERSTNYKVRR